MKKRPAEERFWEKVEKRGDDECWEWTAGRGSQNKYGIFWDGVKKNYAHRFSWEFNNGSIPEGMHVLHRCDNPPCVNPMHLFLGTHQDNMADRDSKGHINLMFVISPRRGEDIYNSKLTDRDVVEIRRLFATGKYLQKELAERYKVSPNTISRVIRRITWNHLQNGPPVLEHQRARITENL